MLEFVYLVLNPNIDVEEVFHASEIQMIVVVLKNVELVLVNYLPNVFLVKKELSYTIMNVLKHVLTITLIIELVNVQLVMLFVLLIILDASEQKKLNVVMLVVKLAKDLNTKTAYHALMEQCYMKMNVNLNVLKEPLRMKQETNVNFVIEDVVLVIVDAQLVVVIEVVRLVLDQPKINVSIVNLVKYFFLKLMLLAQLLMYVFLIVHSNSINILVNVKLVLWIVVLKVLVSLHLNVVMPHVLPVVVVKLMNVSLVLVQKHYLMEFVKTVVLNSNTMTELTLVKNVTIHVKMPLMVVMDLVKLNVVIQVVKHVLVEVILTA